MTTFAEDKTLLLAGFRNDIHKRFAYSTSRGQTKHAEHFKYIISVLTESTTLLIKLEHIQLGPLKYNGSFCFVVIYIYEFELLYIYIEGRCNILLRPNKQKIYKSITLQSSYTVLCKVLHLSIIILALNVSTGNFLLGRQRGPHTTELDLVVHSLGLHE